MTLVSRSIPGLFGGVSQQIPALRHPTQCSVQDNALATLDDGLYKRPGTERVRTLALTGDLGNTVQGSNGAAYVHHIDKGSAGRFELVLVYGSLMLYNLDTGLPETILAPYGRSYLNANDPENDFRCVTVADYTFIVNRTKQVAMTGHVTGSNPTNLAHINVKTAVQKVTYTVTIDGVQVSHTTGDTANNGGIAQALRTAIASAFPSYTVTIIANTNVIRVYKPSGSIECAVSDSWGNQALQYVTAGVDKFSDLPPRFETGFVLTINGTADEADDKYYVQWTGSRWEETAQPALLDTLDKTTLPHQLRPNPSGGWIFEPVQEWATRKVGDDDTNPKPSFVGQKINNAFFFRNRLGFLTGDSVCLSRAGAYFNFWASTATQVVATDPIDLASPSELVASLEWAVPYNQSLLVWADGKQQFILNGGDVLSPETARLIETTTFTVDPRVCPESLGNKVVFASPAGASTQLNLYRVSEDTVTNVAEDLTEHCPTYVPANPRAIVADTALKALVVVPRGPSKVIPLFKYEWENEALKQKAWQRIVFETPDTVRVMAARWVSKTLHLLLHVTAVGDPVPGGRFVLERLNLDTTAVDQGCDIALRLDSRVLASIGPYDGTTTRLDVPYSAVGGLQFFKCVPGQEPEQLVVVSAQLDPSTMTTQTFVQGNLTGATVWAGRPFTMRYEFTEVFLRDADGSPILAATVKLKHLLLNYVDTGWFKAYVTPPLRATYTYPFNGRTVGQPGQGPAQLSLSSGTFQVPVQAKAGGLRVVVESDSHLPCNIPFADWVGDVTMKARR